VENVTGRCDEIERKWIIDPTYAQKLIASATGSFDIQQGYFGDDCRVRVNRGSMTNAVISIKIGISKLTRAEFNYPIPMEDAEQLLSCINTLTKRRHDIGHGFTLDQFFGKLEGFFMIEKEYASEQVASVDQPPEEWVGCQEVTSTRGYTNAELVHLTWDAGIGLFLDDPTGFEYGGKKMEPKSIPTPEEVAHLIVTGDGDPLMPDPLIIP
jgi:CYTH domain-containing protein